MRVRFECESESRRVRFLGFKSRQQKWERQAESNRKTLVLFLAATHHELCAARLVAQKMTENDRDSGGENHRKRNKGNHPVTNKYKDIEMKEKKSRMLLQKDKSGRDTNCELRGRPTHSSALASRQMVSNPQPRR